jgi:hypothetical protein
VNGYMPPVETDPLGAIRKELLSAAWRRKARRDRNRRLATITTTAVVALASVAGAAGALGIDLPVIGDALHRLATVRQSGDEPSGGRGGAEALGEPPVDIEPGRGNTTEELRVASPSGEAVVGAAYLNTRHEACFVVATPDRHQYLGGCSPPRLIGERVDDRIAYVQGVSVAETVVMTGYLSDDVQEIEIDGPHGPLDVAMSRPWAPEAPGATPVRAFLATSGSGGPPDASAVDLDGYAIEARLQDGRRVRIRP